MFVNFKNNFIFNKKYLVKNMFGKKLLVYDYYKSFLEIT